MEDLLVDMFIATAGEKIENKFREKNNNKSFNIICKKYNVDSAQFRKSNYYYTSQIDAYNIIFKNVKKRLLYKKDSIAKIIKKNDSIRITFSKKRNKIENDKNKLEKYRLILKSVDSLIISMTKNRDSLANTLIPLTLKSPNLKKINKSNTLRDNLIYNRIDTTKYLQNIKQQKSEIEVLLLIKKKLNDHRLTSEIDKHITLRQDSILNIKHLLEMDTILYFPIINTKKNTTLDYLKTDNYTNILNETNLFFKNEENRIREDIKVQDSLFKKLQKSLEGKTSNLNQVNFNN